MNHQKKQNIIHAAVKNPKLPALTDYKRGNSAMKQPKISVIIPVFNTEKYLKKCINSVLVQDYPDMEILLVDDGSTDKSPSLCDRYAKRYTQISVVHQTNLGLGAARNTGLTLARGDYLLFVDSDDCLDGPYAVSRLAQKAKKTNADIITGCFRRFSRQGLSGVNRHHLREGAYTLTADFRFKGFFMYGHLAYNWGKLYRKDFLLQNNLLCPAYPFMQDKAHNMACCACEPVYAFIDESVYLYRINKESTSFQYKESFQSVWISVAKDFQHYLAKRHLPETYRDMIAFHLFFGAFFLTKQELLFQKHGIMVSVRKLTSYGENPFVKKYMQLLSQGNFVREIQPFSWKIVIRAASFLMVKHGYFFLVLGIAALRFFQVDQHITKARYRFSVPRR